MAEAKEGIHRTAIREIKILQECWHENIVKVTPPLSTPPKHTNCWSTERKHERMSSSVHSGRHHSATRQRCCVTPSEHPRHHYYYVQLCYSASHGLHTTTTTTILPLAPHYLLVVPDCDVCWSDKRLGGQSLCGPFGKEPPGEPTRESL